MPSRGLETVVQPFVVDDSKYNFDRMIARHEAFNAVIDGTIGKIAALNKELGSLPDAKRISIEVSGVDAAIEKVAALQKALDGLGDKKISVGGDNGEMVRHLQDISTYMDIATDSMGRMEDHLVAIRKGSSDSSAALAAETRMLRDNADAHTARAAAWAASAAASAAAGRGGGSGGGWGAAAAGAAAGGWGAGGWGGAAAATGGGGGGGGFAAGTAAASFANVARFVKTWYPAAHWAMMLSNEVLATVGPAAVAAGAAGLVGMQGGEHVYNRAQAVNTALEALGPAYGTSKGQFLGAGGALQNYQNRYEGGVYGLAGAGLNIASSKAGGGFLQLGGNTLDMLDRAAANIVNSFNNGLGNSLVKATAGGTGYLQQIGDVGANLGKTFLNVAPNLPGVGGDLLSILQGATGGAAKTTGWLQGFLGPMLAGEAAMRWGPGIVGGVGAGASRLGGVIGRAGGGGALSTLGGGIADFGGMLGDMTGPQIGLMGAMAYLVGKGVTYRSPTQAGYAGTVSGVENQNLLQALTGVPGSSPALFSAMNQFGAVPYQRPLGGGKLPAWTDTFRGLVPGALIAPGALGAGVTDIGESLAQIVTGHGGGATGGNEGRWQGVLRAIHDVPWITGMAGAPQTNYQAAQKSLDQLAGSYTNVLSAGQPLVSQWAKLGGGAITMAQGFQLATMAGLNLKDSFAKGGGLNATAQTQFANFYRGFGAMMPTGGAVGTAVSALQAVGGLQQSQVASVNSAYDQLTQIASGGPAGAAALTGLTGAMPAGKGAGRAASQFTGSGSASFWTGFASTSQPSVVSQLQANVDNLRQMLEFGAITKGQAQGLAGYELQQALNVPGVKSSAAAMSYIGQIGSQFGDTTPVTTGNAHRAAQQLNHQLKQTADNSAQFNRNMSQAAIHMNNIPQDARSFVASMFSDQAAQAAQRSAQAMNSFFGSVSGDKFSSSALGKWISTMQHQGVGVSGIDAIVQSALTQHGASPSVLKQALADTYTISGKLAPVASPHLKGDVHWTDVFSNAKPPAKHGDVNYKSNFSHASPPTLHGTVVYDASFAPTPSGGRTLLGGAAFYKHQSGYRVPGYGGGDIHPAFLEGGEAVVPKHLVPQIAPFLGAHGVPGFATGGLAGLGVFEYDTGKAISTLAQAVSSLASAVGGGTNVMPAAAQKVFNAYDATLPKGVFGQFASQLLQGLIDGVKNSPHETAKMAKALVSQVQQEVSYGQGVAAAAKQGGGYNPWGGGSTLLGTFGNLATPTTTASGQPYQYYTDQAAAGGGQSLSVQQQMGDYLQAMKSFQGDLAKLGKAGLNKNLMQQLIAAGPLQGDQEAQSILGGAGGAKGANQLWSQINAAANKLGTSSASTLYGGGKGVKIPVHADTAAAQAAINQIHGKSVVISVSVNLGGGGGGGGGGGVHLSDGQIKSITHQVQAALLRQAKTNRRTGITLPGYGS